MKRYWPVLLLLIYFGLMFVFFILEYTSHNL